MRNASNLSLLMIALLTSTTGAFAQVQSQQFTTTTSTITSGIQAESAEQFLASIATKFGTSVSRLKSLLNKLPPQGKGLGTIEIGVIAKKLGLTKEEKAVLKSKVGAGGTGFNRQDLAEMGVRLGLTSPQVARLSTQLGLASPAIAMPQTVTTPGTLPEGVIQRTTTESAVFEAAPIDPSTNAPTEADIVIPDMPSSVPAEEDTQLK